MIDQYWIMLASLITAVVMLLTAYIIRFIATKTQQLKAATENETVKRYLQEASDAVTDAVLATSQTYVDEMKKSGKFSIDSQKTALMLAVDAAKDSLSSSAADFIETTYGDISKYLESKIEAEIKALDTL